MTKAAVHCGTDRLWQSLTRGGSRIPRKRGRQPSRGRQHMILLNFPKKLHEIAKILVGGGGGGEAPWAPSLRSATADRTI